MFNRHFIREKVLQHIYSFYQGGCNNAVACEKNFELSLKRIHELYIYNLSFLVAFGDYANTRFNMAKERFIKTNDINVAYNLYENKLLAAIRESGRFAIPNAQYKFSWKDKELLFKNLYEEMIVSPFYISYVESLKKEENSAEALCDGGLSGEIEDIEKEIEEFLGAEAEAAEISESSGVNGDTAEVSGGVEAETCEYYDSKPKISPEEFDRDKQLLITIFRRLLLSNESFYSLCEEYSLSWAANIESTSFWALRSLKDSRLGSDMWIYSEIDTRSEELLFGKELLQKLMVHGKDFDELISQNSKARDFDRLAIMDIIIIRMALVEMVHFPSIPIRASIDEYIELSKAYSSEDSYVFVNGILHKLSDTLQENKTIRKTGRGLI